VSAPDAILGVGRDAGSDAHWPRSRTCSSRATSRRTIQRPTDSTTCRPIGGRQPDPDPWRELTPRTCTHGFLYEESCGQCPACKFGTGETTRLLAEVESERASDQSVESILIRARGSTDGQKCALPTGESLLIQSLVQVFAEEFRGHVGRACPLPRELVFHKIVDWDTANERFVYDESYQRKQPDWTFAS
jgi:hypothetical protein